MIEELRIRALGVIDEAMVELDPGLTVVTGETGAGKTMVITGLGLLLGARADGAVVRLGADRAEVEGHFRLTGDSSVAETVDDVGGVLDDETLVVRRSVASEGRSRAFVGGAGVPVAILSQLAPELVMVHGQSDQQGLLQPVRQRELLDAFGQLADHANAYRAAYDVVSRLHEEVLTLTRERQERIREAELLRFGVEEVAQVAPMAGEDEALKIEDDRLSHAEDLRQAAAMVHGIVDDDSERAVVSQLGEVRRVLERVGTLDPALADLAKRAAEVGYLATELASALTAYIESIDADPNRLSQVGERRAELSTLTRKYGSSVDEVLAWSERANNRLVELDATDDVLAQLTVELDEARTHQGECALELSLGRARAAQQLSKAVTSELADLAMPDAALIVAVLQKESPEGLVLPDGRSVVARADGVDDVSFLLRPHADGAERPLGKGASGGELSRIMLALEVVLAGVNTPPTLVFDEVDAGVGGRAAVEVGRHLAMLAATSQVVVVTHLPQVAAFADRHLVVTKSSDGAVTSSDIRSLDDRGRAQELARMLAGLEDSELGRAHAAELLDLAAKAKQSPR